MLKNRSASQRVVVSAALLQTDDTDNRSYLVNLVKDGAKRQREKITKIGDALREAGYVTATEQARALGLPRSTAWMISHGAHKTSGLHAGLIVRMMAQKDLPPAVRLVLREYVIEKTLGHYGHNFLCRRRFAAYFWDTPEFADWLTDLRSKKKTPLRPGWGPADRNGAQ